MRHSLPCAALLPLAAIAGCASGASEFPEDSAEVSSAGQAMVAAPTYEVHAKAAPLSIFPMKNLVFTTGLTYALDNGGFAGKSAATLPGIDPETRDYSLALKDWDRLMTIITNVSTYKLSAVTTDVVGRSGAYNYQFTSAGSPLTLTAKTEDVQGVLYATAPYSLIVGGERGQAYVKSTQCRNELSLDPELANGTWSTKYGPNPCASYRAFLTGIIDAINLGGGQLAKARAVVSGFGPTTSSPTADFKLRCDLFYDPINADQTLSATVTNASHLCGIAPKVSATVYANASQPVNSKCSRASANGILLQGATCGNGYALNSLKRCIPTAP